MDKKLFDKLIAMPALNQANRQVLPCKVCGCQAYFFDVVDLNKTCSRQLYPFGASGIPVLYFRCADCGFLFTQFFDDWTPRDFARFVYNEDYVKVDGEYAGARPDREAAAMARRLASLSHLRILDYGSGSGFFADKLRSRGFANVSNYDPFSSPNRPDGHFDLVTCFEVLEHATSPRTTLLDIASFLEPKGCVFFSTSIQPPSIGEIRANWWYVAPRNGHVSIYSRKALAFLGESAGLILHLGPGGTAFSRPSKSAASRRLLSSVGRPLKFLQLAAPDETVPVPLEQEASWHCFEGAGSEAFRWTREQEISWRVQEEPFEPCELVIDIPIQNEIQPGFADGSRLEIGNRSAPVVREITGLTATIEIHESVEAVVKLMMPPLLRPCDLRSVTDSRYLGLAISAKPRSRVGLSENLARAHRLGFRADLSVPVAMPYAQLPRKGGAVENCSERNQELLQKVMSSHAECTSNRNE